MQTAHAAFELSSVDVANLGSLGGFYEYTTEKPNHARRVEQMVWLIGWHRILNASDKVIAPRPVLVAHMFLL